MTVKECLRKAMEDMPEDKLREVLDFALFINAKEEREEWMQIGQAQLARAYGADEPEYTLADLKPEPNS